MKRGKKMKKQVSNKADAISKLGKNIAKLPINTKPYAPEENKLNNKVDPKKPDRLIAE
jgi:hypothetical protein